MSHKPNSLQEIDVDRLMKVNGQNGFIVDINSSLLSDDIGGQTMFRNGIVIILCKGEGGSLVVDSKSYQLSDYNIIILPENHIINYAAIASSVDKNIIVVSVDYILNMPSPIDTNIFSYSRYMSLMKISGEKFDDLQNYFRFLAKEFGEQSKYQNQIIQSIFYALILEIIGEYERLFSIGNNSEIRADSLSDRFFRLLAQHYRVHRTVQFYADKLNLTAKYLSTAIKRITGRPILDWIHEAILIDAKMLLRSTDLTVQQIADQLNFSSPSAFVQFFKKHTGTTPRKL